MNNIRDSVSNLKASLLKFLILFVMMLSCSFLFTGITTYATDSSADQGGSGSGSGLSGSTVSSSRSGWLIYVVDQAGQLKSPDVAIWFTNGLPDLEITEWMALTRFHGIDFSNDQVYTNFEYGAPLVNGNGQGSTVRNKLVQSTNGVENWSSLIEKLWGPDLVKEVAANEYALILEPVYYYNIYKNGSKTSDVILGTANTIAGYQEVNGIGSYGDTQIKRYTNNNFPHSAKFQQDRTIVGITVPSTRSGYLTNQQIMAEGYGLIAIWPQTSSIHTYDGVNSPGKSPLTPKGIANIVKSYHTVNESTGEDIDDGCFITTNVSNNIIIDDEDEYKVEKWVVTDSDPTEVPGNSWNPPGTVQDSGNSSGSTTVKDPGKTLFVLLKKTEQEEEEEIPEGIDYVIEQSQITKQVLLSEAQTNPDAKNIKTYEFKWNLPSLKNSCPGHRYKSGEHNVYDEDGDFIGTEDEYSNAYCGNWQITDKTITVGLKNDLYLDYPEILADSNAWRKLPAIGEQTTQTYDRGNNFGSHDKGYTNWDYKMVIHRGNDKLTLAEWKGLGLEVAEV